MIIVNVHKKIDLQTRGEVSGRVTGQESQLDLPISSPKRAQHTPGPNYITRYQKNGKWKRKHDSEKN